MKKQKIQLSLDDFPQEIHPYLNEIDIYDSSCHSNAQTLFLPPDHFLKIDAAGALAREAMLTRQFYERGLGVEVIAYLSTERDYMLTLAATGQDCTHWTDDPKRLCEIMAYTLRHLHSKPVVGMPLSLSYEKYLKSASGPSDGGNYDPSVVMKRFPVVSQAEAWQIMQKNKYRLQADTLIHGDYCLPNIVCDINGETTLIDLALAGVGDRHIDLYWAIWSLEYNLGTDAYTDCFLDRYGRENFDYDMLQVIAAFEVFG